MDDSWNIEASERDDTETAIVDYLRKTAESYRGSSDAAAKALLDAADDIELGNYR